MATGNYTLPIGGQWSLEDLYVLPRTYEQVYFLVYSLSPDQSDSTAERIARAYESLPWQGGYSAVSFYNQLKYITPKRERPSIASIEYSSPGWIELALILSVALNVQKIVKSIAKTFEYANATYNEIMEGMQKRKMLRLEAQRQELELKQRELEFIDAALKQMSHLLGVSSPAALNALTGHPYRSLKILLSLYRRVRTLVKYQINGKADFVQATATPTEAIATISRTRKRKTTRKTKTRMACTRFRRHRVRCFHGTGGESWTGGSSHESSSLRLCA